MTNALNLDNHIQQYLALSNWFDSPQGLRVAQAFIDEIACFQSQLRGESLLQLGSCGQNPWLPHFDYSRKIIVSPCVNQKGVAINALVNQLPIDRDSIDCIIAPLTFEACLLNKDPMDELDRILKPMGYIVFWGINPLSFWGLALRVRYLSIFAHAKVTLKSVLSIKRAVLSRGYQQCALSTFYYIPPVTSEKLIHDLAFLNEMGKMLWIFPAGFYCLIVQKYRVIAPSLTVEAVDKKYFGCVDNSLA